MISIKLRYVFAVIFFLGYYIIVLFGLHDLWLDEVSSWSLYWILLYLSGWLHEFVGNATIMRYFYFALLQVTVLIRSVIVYIVRVAISINAMND